MTVASTLARKACTVAGAGPYAIPFYFLDNADIIVIQTPASGAAPITLTLTTDYTLTGAGDTAGGALTLVKTGIDGDALIIINEPAIDQLTQYPETGPFPAKSHETALDKLTMVAKRIYDMASRSLRLNDGDLASSLTLPAPSDGKLLGWSGGVLTNTSPAGVGPGTLSATEMTAAYEASLVHTTGAETVAGVKTFSSSPVVPDATGATQAASKGQMDTADTAAIATAEAYADLGDAAVISAITLRSYVRLNTPNGYGDVSHSCIRRFLNVVQNVGSDITYADSATLGGTFTINTNGIYSISYSDQFNGSYDAGLSLNTTAPSSNIATLAASEILHINSSGGAGYAASSSYTGYFAAGSVIRAHTTGAAAGAYPQKCQFSIARVA